MKSPRLHKLIIPVEVGFSIFLSLLLLLMHPKSLLEIGVVNIGYLLLLLLVYGAIGLILHSRMNKKAVDLATRFGFYIGIIFTLDLILETFIDLGNQGNSIGTFIFMGIVFFSWAIVGAIGRMKTDNFRMGILISLWSSMVAILIAIIVGLFINLLFSNHLEQTLLYSQEYMRSPLRDIKIFTLYNTLIDSAITHLI